MKQTTLSKLELHSKYHYCPGWESSQIVFAYIYNHIHIGIIAKLIAMKMMQQKRLQGNWRTISDGCSITLVVSITEPKVLT